VSILSTFDQISHHDGPTFVAVDGSACLPRTESTYRDTDEATLTTGQHEDPARSVQYYLLVLRRHKLMIVAIIALTIGVTLAFSLHQSKLYKASVQVFLNDSNPAQLLTGVSAATEADIDPARVVANQTSIATSPTVLNATTHALGLTVSGAASFLSTASVTGAADRDILTFQSEAATASGAAHYVNVFAQTYANYAETLDTSTLKQAIAGVMAELQKLHGGGRTAADRSLYDQLSAKEQQLNTLETLQTAQAVVLGPAAAAALVRPSTKRNVLLAAVLGVLLALGAAFLRDVFDRRIRDGDQIATILGIPLFGRIPPPPRRAQMGSYLVMKDAPFGLHAESFRMLRGNLDIAMGGDGLEGSARTIVVTSAIADEGKTTTVSNLALTYARAGLRVALVDLDLRRPGLKRFFRSFSSDGLGATDVVLHHASLEDVLVDVPLTVFGADNGSVANGGPVDSSVASEDAASRTQSPLTGDHGSLSVLLAGQVPRNIGEFVGTPALRDLLADLRTRVDLVFIDTPPLLTFSDGATIARIADGVILVTRLNRVTRTQLREAQRLLVGASGRQPLGFVATGSDEDEHFRPYDQYGSRSGYRQYSSAGP